MIYSKKAICVALACCCLSGTTFAQHVSLTLNNVTVKQAMDALKKQSGYSFVFSSEDVDTKKKVSVDADDQKVEEVVRQILDGQSVTYEIKGKNIVVQSIAQTSSSQQKKTITGTIVDPSGMPVIGANVMVKGTTNGTITDMDGKFSLEVPKESMLVVSYIGYANQEIKVSNQTNLSIALKEDVEALDELVVVGYGTQIKRAVTGAVQSLDAEDMEDLPVSQISQKMQGKFAGVQINQVSGKPGQGMTMRIRGQASLSGGTTPLYVVDGMPLVGDISTINPDEIENISVLKDASSTSLYGSRAANGVVLITTKQAKGKKQLGIDIYAGVQYVPQTGRPEMMNASEYAQFRKELAEENGLQVDPIFQHPEKLGIGTDWYSILFRPAAISNYCISYGNASDKFKSSSVVSYYNQNGVLTNSNYQRFSARANTEYAFNKMIKLGLNIAPSFSINNTPQSDGNWTDDKGAIIQGAMLTTPLAPYKNPDGSIPLTAMGPGSFDNPNWYNVVRLNKNKTQNTHVLANAFVEIEPIKNLKLKTSINGDLTQNKWNSFKPSTSGEIYKAPYLIPQAQESNELFYTWLWENTAMYSKTIGEHNFDVLFGISAQKYRSEYTKFSGTDFPDDKIPTFNAASTITGQGDINEWSLLSYIGRINYNYKGRYLLSLAMRRDGSSRFGVDNRWGNFPSVSIGWIVSDESFWESLSNEFSFFKLRASYGVVGNDQIGNYTHLATIVTTNSNFNNVFAGGRSISGMGNPNLGWERNRQLDLGIDLAFFNNRLSLMYDYYNKRTDALLFSLEVPIASGFFNVQSNAGDLQFWGHELTISSKNFTGDFQWTTDLNVSYNDNKCLSLGVDDAPLISGNNITRVGERIGQFYGLVHEGVYRNQEEYEKYPKHAQADVGTVRFRDVNGDGIINQGDDRTILGNPVPLWLLGMTNTLAYKNFDLSIVVSGGFKFQLANMVDQFAGNLDGVFNVYKDVANRWKSPEDPGDGHYGTTKLGTTAPERDWFSSRYLYNANYLTIKNITLGYQVPLKNQKMIKGLRAYMSFQNVYTFTKYINSNPEINVNSNGSNASSLQQGFDYTTYPIPRTITVGINANF